VCSYNANNEDSDKANDSGHIENIDSHQLRDQTQTSDCKC